mmetsp:Transcript_20983/g.54195  ORF Transcript_20983/g.54195 Transcript_20983/m.54195 type:complete len:228 (-) Transcript_20983:185-868(-)
MCGEQADPNFQEEDNEEGLPTKCYKCGNTTDDLYLPFSKDIIENGKRKKCPCNHALCLECVEDVARTDLPENSNVVCGEVSSQACDCTIKPPRLRKFLGYDPQIKKELDNVFKSSCNNCHKPLREDLLEEGEFSYGAHCPECQAPYCPLCYATYASEFDNVFKSCWNSCYASVLAYNKATKQVQKNRRQKEGGEERVCSFVQAKHWRLERMKQNVRPAYCPIFYASV